MGLTRVVIKFDLSFIPQNAEIISSSILLHFFDSTDWKGTGDILAFQLTTPWNESGELPDWNTFWNEPGGDFDSTRLDGIGRGTGLGWSTVTMETEVIQSLVKNPETNNGFILIPRRDPGLLQYGGKVHLSEAGYEGAYGGTESNGQFAPKLEITYDVGTAIKTNQSIKFKDGLNVQYHSDSIDIQCANVIEGISLISMQGRVLVDFMPHSVSNKVTIPFGRVGVYTLVVKSPKGQIVKKIFKR